ncbi:MAG: ABC transporter ATP-binding protein [Pirellulales bacterium]
MPTLSSRLEAAIRVENLAKRYRVSQAGRGWRGYRTLRETLAGAATSLARRWRHGHPDEEFWALHDVGFEIAPGEVVGIIGGNGAGKSTLLKILSRITRPTRGRVEIRGRVGSLLEVGTGFHPELTGRENIFLNGAILGMTRREILRSFEAIVDFAGVEPFLDTPVKRYSSGMHVRLAFAVAAHLEPEILIVDEVLAVGDAQFQKKCLGKMGQVAEGGRTVLFVSHNMAAVQNLCRRVVHLDKGRVIHDGDTESCIAAYLRSMAPPGSKVDLRQSPQRKSGSRPTLTELEICDVSGELTTCIKAGDALVFKLHYESPHPLTGPAFRVIVSTITGTRVFTVNTRWNAASLEEAPAHGCAVCTIPGLPLVPGEYVASVGCNENGQTLDFVDGVAGFSVEPSDYFGTGQLPKPMHGATLVEARWDVLSGNGDGPHPGCLAAQDALSRQADLVS